MAKSRKIECWWCGKVTRVATRSEAKYCPPQPGKKQSDCLLARNRARRQKQQAKGGPKPTPTYQYECFICKAMTGKHPKCEWCRALVHDGETKRFGGKQVCHRCLSYREYQPVPIEHEVYVKPGFDYGG